ncbi:MAG: S9 family peptidase, partial [Gemmatimonadetes bacterium]|nr:S9 family peptidase [Gemmatimonadota bacterium]NIT67740.1 S9 family peptidase [Gemmatimonadota bacterium]NIY36317.1 S9 family peptidase [Gemmatimonadota bacterium]
EISDVQATKDAVYFQGASATKPPQIVRLDLATGETTTLAASASVEEEIVPYLSEPETLALPREDGSPIHAYFYPPMNPDYAAPEGEKPPVIVQVHGGPTARRSNAFDLRVQYWTSRGFAWLDVNYGG